jgi:bifunctional DNA-binding transcriptional regulator/antitoxin component of YhaV-PrlF toxin-antitoxin module
MIIKTITKINKGNNNGVGFIRLPAPQRQFFKIDESFKVTMIDKKTNPMFYGRIKHYSGLGIFVPKEIVAKNNLLHKEFIIFFEKINGFHTKLTSDGRLYIPKNIFEIHGLEYDDIVLVSANIDNRKLERYCRVRKRIKEGGTLDCFCVFDSGLSGKEGIFKIEKKIKKPNKGLNKILEMLKDLNLGLDGDIATVFDGHKVPIKINIKVKMHNFAYYLGHFFADGTKKGNSWGLCLSTFEQANAFIEMHKKLIPDANLDTYLSFSGSENLKNSLIDIWHKKTRIRANKIVYHKSYKNYLGKRNEFGTLVLREHRKLTQIYYNRLIDLLFKEIEQHNDKKLAIDFVCGVMEGDGSPSSKSHGHIIISTNKKDAVTLEKIIEKSDLQFKVCEEDKGKKVYIRIGALGILENLHILKDKLFKYYPKRRARFIKRFHGVGAVRFILGEQDYASGWVKTYLKSNGILDDDYKLTTYGRKIRKCLKDMIGEIEPIKNI